jgi:hypothetical protein
MAEKVTENTVYARPGTSIRAASLLNRNNVPANDATMLEDIGLEDIEHPDSGKK